MLFVFKFAFLAPPTLTQVTSLEATYQVCTEKAGILFPRRQECDMESNIYV